MSEHQIQEKKGPVATGRQRIYYLDVARAFAVLMICLNHAVNRCYSMYHNQQAEFLASNFLSQVIKAVAGVSSRLGVPMFLMITGVLLLDRFQSPKQILPFYRKNVKGLLITTELWYGIFFLFLLAFKPSYELVNQGIPEILYQLFRTLLLIEPISLGSMWYMPMILCMYLMLPFLSLAFRQIEPKHLILPGIVLYFSWMVLPNLEKLAGVVGISISLDTALKTGYLISPYLLYMTAGWCVGCRDILKKVPSAAVYSLTLLLFSAIAALQLYCFTVKKAWLLGYEFSGYLILSFFLLESIRRISPKLEKIRPAVSYLAKISFGIYFVHIPIMEYMKWYWNPAFPRPLKMMVYWLVPIGLSVLVIYVTGKNKCLRKYLYYMH